MKKLIFSALCAFLLSTFALGHTSSDSEMSNTEEYEQENEDKNMFSKPKAEHHDHGHIHDDTWTHWLTDHVLTKEFVYDSVFSFEAAATVAASFAAWKYKHQLYLSLAPMVPFIAYLGFHASHECSVHGCSL